MLHGVWSMYWGILKTQNWNEIWRKKFGKMPTLRHNELRDRTTDLMSDVCRNVCTEPELQPLLGEILHERPANCQERTRGDIRGGDWILGEMQFLM